MIAKAPLFSRLGPRLFLLLLILLIPAFGLVWRGNMQQRRLAESGVRDRILGISQLAAANQERFIANTRQLLSTLAELRFLVLATDRKFCEIHFQNLVKLSPDYLNFGLIESNGTLFCSARATNNSIHLGDRSYFQRVLQTKRFAAGEFQVGRLTGEPALNFAQPVFSTNGELQRVLFASLKVSLLSEAISRIRLPSNGALTIIDRAGTILARHPDPQGWVGRSMQQTPFVHWVLGQKDAIEELPGIDGIPRLYAVTPISDGQSATMFASVGIPLASSFADARRALIYNSLLMALVAVLVSAGAHLYAGRYVLRPIHALVEAAQRLAQGDLTARTGISPGTAELNQLARAFDSMAEIIERRQAEVQQAHTEITRINAELEERVKKRTAELAAANQELEAFSYSVSHDLRAPLRHIDGFVSRLAKSAGDTLEPKNQRYLGLISESARDMARLIDDLLVFARMGRVEMRYTGVDLNTVLDDAIHALREEIQGREILWKRTRLPTVHCDLSLIRQVFINLLSNAVKYTRPRSTAEIEIGTASETGDEVVIFVRDNGVGFDMEYASKLFGVFQRLHRVEEFEGTGIGLANVRRIVQRHGGRTWAEGQVEKGATFYFSLTKADPVSR